MRTQRIWAWGAMALGLLVASSGSLADTYGIGFVWNRDADWTVRPSGDDMTSNGNPDDDALGNPVWSYEYFDGVSDDSGLGSASPWYAHGVRGAMVWDEDFAGSGGRWVAHGNDMLPNLAHHVQNHIQNDWDPGSYGDVPLVRWMNPSSVPLVVSISSGPGNDFSMGWWGQSVSGASEPMLADVAIVLVDASQGGSMTLLYSQTVSKPTADFSDERIPLPSVDIPSLLIEPGDEILITCRARPRHQYPSGFRGISFADSVSITVVPEPTVVGLLAIGAGLGLLRRRRKERTSVR